MELLTASAADVDCSEAVGALAAFGPRRTRDIIARETVRCSSSSDLIRKGKRKEVYLYSAFIVATTLKALRRGSHSFTCK